MTSTITRFLNSYGSTMTDEQGRTAKGICTRIGTPSPYDSNVCFEKLGFTVKREYLLIVPAESGMLTVNARITVGDLLLCIISTDTTCFTDQTLCQRAYAYQVKEDF